MMGASGMVYATTDDLAAYLGKQESELPGDAARLLERASELVDFATFGRAAGDPEAAKKAVCAQVEHWLLTGEEQAITGPVQQASLGSLSITYTWRGPLAPRAVQHLLMAGLLSRAVAV